MRITGIDFQKNLSYPFYYKYFQNYPETFQLAEWNPWQWYILNVKVLQNSFQTIRKCIMVVCCGMYYISMFCPLKPNTYSSKCQHENWYWLHCTFVILYLFYLNPEIHSIPKFTVVFTIFVKGFNDIQSSTNF